MKLDDRLASILTVLIPINSNAEVLPFSILLQAPKQLSGRVYDLSRT